MSDSANRSLGFGAAHVMVPHVTKLSTAPNPALPNLKPRTPLRTPRIKHYLRGPLPASNTPIFAGLINSLLVDRLLQQRDPSSELIRPGQAERRRLEILGGRVVAPAGEEAHLVV